jgi:hypothetical protein
MHAKEQHVDAQKLISPNALHSAPCRTFSDHPLGKKQHSSLHPSRLMYLVGPQVHDSRQLSSPGRLLGLQGQWCWRWVAHYCTHRHMGKRCVACWNSNRQATASNP